MERWEGPFKTWKISTFSGKPCNKISAASWGKLTKRATSRAHHSWDTMTASQLYRFGDTFPSWECRLCLQRGLTSSWPGRFFQLLGLCGLLAFVAQFPDEIIILWLLCSFIRSFQNRTLHQFGTRVQRDCVPTAALRHDGTGPGFQVMWKRLCRELAQGPSTSNSSLGNWFSFPDRWLFLYMYLHSVNVYQYSLHIRYILNGFGGPINAYYLITGRGIAWLNQR